MRIDGVRIDLVESGGDGQVLADLAEVLQDCVIGGASVGFVATPRLDEAEDLWRDALNDDSVLVWVARDDADRVIGTVQLRLARQENGAHRAEIAKLLVHRSARGRGVAVALMAVAESEAARRGRILLLLDTQTGSDAERLYARCGWQPIGVVEEYAAGPDGGLHATTFMIKPLTSAR